MSFLLTCPNCGERGVNEFRFGGEVASRPAPDATREQWTAYTYLRRNAAGDQREWWYHSYGCRQVVHGGPGHRLQPRALDILA